jgi:ABC-type bacteriocin/lantibiotic exporter with double-glycine peptidase domain
VLKDEYNKKAHEESAQLACEAAGAIRTVAALAREDDCCRIYSESLEGPLRKSNRSALSSDLLYATSQSMSFCVIALIFWYGSVLVSKQELSTFRFFVSLMVCNENHCVNICLTVLKSACRVPLSVPSKPATSFHSFQTSPLRRAQR